MAYIKKNVNIALLVLLALIIASFIGFTTYYEGIYKNISGEYSLKQKQLNVLDINLSAQLSKINQTTAELNKKIRDKEKFDVLYTEVVDEKAALKEELITTMATLKKAQSDLDTANIEIKDLNLQVKDLKESVKEKEDEIDELGGSISAKNTWLCLYNSSFC